MIRSLVFLLVTSLLVIRAPGTVAGQTATSVASPLAACTVTPRTPEDLHALLGDDYVEPSPVPLAVQATPGGEWTIGVDALPEGTPADSAEIEAVVQEMYACLAAGDMLRYLALFTDDEILESRFLGRLGTLMATPEFQTPTPSEHNGSHQTRGLFHARLLPDGRMAGVAPIGFMGLPELYLFAHENGQWRIDEIVPLAGAYATSGEDRTAFTGSEFISSGMRDLVIYGWGLEFGPEWTPVVNQDTNSNPGLAVLTNDVSLVIAGIAGARGTDLDTCVHPPSGELASSLKHAGLKDVAAAIKQGLVPVTAADGSPLQGAAGDRAFAVYALADPAEGSAALDGERRVYIECRIMAGGVWTLGVTHIVPAAAYEAEAARRDDLLASLEDLHAVEAPAS